MTKEHEALDDKPPIQIYVNIIQRRVEFKIETGYCLELLTHEAKELHRSSERRTTKDKNVENEPQLKSTEVLLIHCNIVNSQYKHDVRV